MVLNIWSRQLFEKEKTTGENSDPWERRERERKREREGGEMGWDIG
jgi:hypothetical protein